MKKLLTITLLIAFHASVFGQKQKEEKIEYYTDSDVKRSIVSVQAGYMPFYTGRRLVNTSFLPSTGFYFINENVTGQYGNAYGFDLLFKLGQGLNIGAGLYNNISNWRYDGVKILDDATGNGDTLGGVFQVDMRANYLNVPIQFCYAAQVADQWYLQVVPALEVNFLQSLERNYNISNPNLRPKNEDAFGDITSRGRDINLTINFGLGAEYRFLENLGTFVRLNFRYQFYEIEENAAINEVIYTIGGHMGMRYYF